MALGETESGLFGLLANEPTDVFEPMGAALECLGAWVHRSYDIWVRPWTEPDDCWLLGDGSMATDLAPAKR